MKVQLHSFYDRGRYAMPIATEDKGSYGLAIESMAVMLGCDEMLWHQIEDSIVMPASDGWVVVSDGESSDAIYHNNELLVTIEWAGRGTWNAVATHVDGRKWYAKGANTELAFDDWQAMQ